MGKGQRSRAARAEEMARKKIEAKKKAKRDKITKICGSVVAILLVIAIVGGIIFNSVSQGLRNNGTYLNRDTAMSTKNYKITNAQMMYFFQNYYSAFMSQNESYLSYYGLDKDKSLKEQNYPGTTEDGKTQTWYDYFMTSTTAQVKQSLVLAEAAKAANVTLSDEEKKNIDKAIENITPENFAPGLTKDAIKACMEIATLAEDYRNQVTDAIEVTDAAINDYYGSHKDDYDQVDYRLYTFNYKAEDTENADGEEAAESASTMTKEEAKKLADELAKSKDEAAFTAWLTDYFKKELKKEGEDLQNEVDGTKTTGFSYSESYVGNEFLFSAESKALQTKVVEAEEDHGYKVFMLLKPRYKDTTVLKNVRHILFEAAQDDDNAKAEAKKKADDALAQWKKNGGTEDAFAKLATELTADTGSKEKGGLYENVKKGQMVAEFENWAFDAARKAGDTGIVQTTYGYHVMYFVSNGDEAWKASVRSDYTSSEYQKKYDEFAGKYEVKQNDKNIAKIASYIK